MFKKKRIVALTLMIVLLISLNFSGAAAGGKAGLLIPIGRLLDRNQVRVSINSKPYQAEIIADGCGGSWFRIPITKLNKKAKIGIKIMKTTSNNLFFEENISVPKWTTPCSLIDSDNPEIIKKAQELTQGAVSSNEKAQQILDFVVENIKFEMFPRMHYQTASDTLRRGGGICVNHSRLFTALCRAVGVPARTISGACTNDKNDYYHHEWAEFYDDERSWRPIEPLFSTDQNFTDLKRINLIYDIESNPIYPFDQGWENDRVKLSNGDISIFCPDWGLQQATGGMSFQMLQDRFPETVEIGMDYQVFKYL